MLGLNLSVPPIRKAVWMIWSARRRRPASTKPLTGNQVMKSGILRSALLIAACAASTAAFGQNSSEFEPANERGRMSTPQANQWRIIDPIAKQKQEVKAKAAQREGGMIVPPPVEWHGPLPQAARPIGPVVITAAPVKKSNVRQADVRLETEEPLVPQIRLVQAEDDAQFLDDLRSAAEEAGSNEIDELLQQAERLIQEERIKGNDNQLGPDQIRNRMQDELDRLLPGESDDGRGGLGSLADEDEEDAEEDFSNLVDPQPQPIYRRSNRRQVPYTMGDIFDDDEVDPCCERMFCERMWACAGGKCMEPIDRIKRDMARNYALFYGDCNAPICRPMENFKCPPRQQSNPQHHHVHNHGGAGNGESTLMDEYPIETFPEADYPLEALPTDQAPMELAPIVDQSTSAIDGVVQGLRSRGK